MTKDEEIGAVKKAIHDETCACRLRRSLDDVAAALDYQGPKCPDFGDVAEAAITTLDEIRAKKGTPPPYMEQAGLGYPDNAPGPHLLYRFKKDTTS